MFTRFLFWLCGVSREIQNLEDNLAVAQDDRREAMLKAAEAMRDAAELQLVNDRLERSVQSQTVRLQEQALEIQSLRNRVRGSTASHETYPTTKPRAIDCDERITKDRAQRLGEIFDVDLVSVVEPEQAGETATSPKDE